MPHVPISVFPPDCALDLNFLKAQDLLFVCDVGFWEGKKLSQQTPGWLSTAENWGWLHYKPGVPWQTATAGVPGVHRYFACYGDKSATIQDDLAECGANNRNCGGCVVRFEIFFSKLCTVFLEAMCLFCRKVVFVVVVLRFDQSFSRRIIR